ncbi:MAG: BrnA antitoxin family protein [Magnetococcus sp. YQC-9]
MEFRNRALAVGTGYQTMVNDALREYLVSSEKPLEATLCRVIREELQATS